MKTVLVVEDNAAHMEYTAFLLAEMGYAVLRAATAEDGLALAREKRPDAVMMDLILPGMDGISAIRALRADPATRDIQLLAMTSFREPETGPQTVAAGAHSFLPKPFHYKDLESEIRSLLEGRAQAAAT